MNYTEIEAKVREATNDDSWGPTGTPHISEVHVKCSCQNTDNVVNIMVCFDCMQEHLCKKLRKALLHTNIFLKL